MKENYRSVFILILFNIIIILLVSLQLKGNVFASSFSIEEEDEKYNKLKSKYIQDFEKYYAILGCNSNDSNEHIKKQYRKLVSDYHPDKIASKGLPEEFTKFANNKFREIQEAYETIKKERNIR